MHPSDCPDWEYKDYPRHTEILKRQTASVLSVLRRGQLEFQTTAKDTRQVHHHFFRELTPVNHEYFAGHYRGEKFRCLEYYQVIIRSDPRVGWPPQNIAAAMSRLARETIGPIMVAMNEAQDIPNVVLAPEEKLTYAITFACRVFEEFLRIHPYANGNGHIARFLIWVILGYCGYWPNNWRIEPRPNPPYNDLIVEYRNGNCEPLEKLILSSLR
jgi:hypothetical protein